MERRHEELLTARLEDAWLNGCSHITYPELYLWYDVQKIAAGTWRDLDTRWKEVTREDRQAGPLNRIEGRSGIFIFDGDKANRINPDE